MSRELGRVARSIEPDLVHAHYLPEYGWMAAREGLRPLICSAWGSDVLAARGINRSRSRCALREASLVFVDSAHLGREAHAFAGAEIPVEVVRWGLDLETFAPGDRADARASLGVPLDGPLVVSVRGMKPVYNPQLLLETFARVRTGRPDARLLLKHPQAETPDFVARAIERLRLADAVTVVGNLPADLLPEVYRAADVVVSLASSDSSPRSVWEALACARPVVVSDLPWAREELTDRQALLVPLDVAAIADAIGRVLGEPGLASQLGAAGRELASAELDPIACRARVNSLYRSVVGAGS
jgi:glycosyltransferase involved in cell wall biosynthesis